MREQIYKTEGYQNLKEMLQKTGEKFGDRPAYIFKTEVEFALKASYFASSGTSFVTSTPSIASVLERTCAKFL